MQNTKVRIAVIGAGIGGLAVSVGLRRFGAEVTVFEQSEELGIAGAGVLLQQPGLKALEHLGLLQDVLKLGAKVCDLKGSTGGGKILLDLDLREIETFAIGVHRGALFQVLQHACVAKNVTIKCGRRVLDLTSIGDGFDFVFVADGSASTLRTQICGVTAKEYDWAALWTSMPCGNWPYPKTLWQCFDGTKQLLGFLPTGKVDQGGEELVSIFWSVFGEDAEEIRTRNSWQQSAIELAPFARGILEKVDSSKVVVARYRHATAYPLAKYNGTPVCFIGDASHAMSPQLGLGANLALVEAEEYSSALLGTSNLDVVAKSSAHRGKFCATLSHLLFPLFQSNSGWVGPIRDAIGPTIVRIPLVKKQMLKTFSGRKVSWFS